MKKFISNFLWGALIVTSVVSLRGESALLGHKGLAGQVLDAEDVKAVLLGKKVRLGDARVVIVIAKNSGTQEQFLLHSVGMTTSQFQNYWRRLFMTGGGSAPKIVETDTDAMKLVTETAGAVAILDNAAADGLVVLATAK